jgi:alkylated DNA repair dioxygenase AlkB
MSDTLFDDSEFETLNLLPKEGEVFYYPNFLTKEEADKYFTAIQAYTDWQQDSINFGGKAQLIPRLQAWYGDEDKTFTYSGITLKPKQWTQELMELNVKLQEKLSIVFSSVLVNQYRFGNDSVAWHCDDEAELGVNPIIASISLGATRTFKFRNLADKSLKREMKLEHGSLVVMQGETQHKWQHSVPKEPLELNPRINLTYRVIKSAIIDI